ncbi:heterokaryon incompatibility protein-domain-containing protein [Bisporella sp. PMI_857]|nr:heterokaryon incompatibility protein-domain-containing protein [Bisporella sp. PMI_857]
MTNLRYSYEKLQPRQIRLLDLQPGDPGSELTGAIRHVSIDDEPLYEALSYTWGANDSASSLHVVGSLISLTLNLDQALQRLRYRERVRTVWIDQICINQKDNVERSQQVRMMGEIYRKAGSVDIWLGEEDEDTELAISLIPYLVRCFDEAEEEGGGSPASIVLRKLGILYIESPSWVSLRTLFGRPYFRRMWIVQEAVFGARCMVHIGSFSITWEDLAKSALCLEIDYELQAEALRVTKMIGVMKTKLLSAHAQPFLELLSQTKDLLCTDPRDKVYGIRGLSSDVQDGELVPDYTRSMQDVYLQAAKFCIIKYQTLGILSCVAHPQNIPNLPSWVPDWTALSNSGESLWFKASERYSAGGTTQSSHTFSPNGRILYASGKYIDIIEQLGSVINHQSQLFDEWDRFSKSVSPYFTGETYPRTLWRTLFADSGKHGLGSDNTREDLWKSHHSLMVRNREHAIWKAGARTTKVIWEPEHEMSIVNSRALESQALMQSASYGRRIAVTNDKYLALVPASAKVGDHICIFQGAKVPFVLRQKSGTTICSLIGESYLQGWMDGRCYGQSAASDRDFMID